MNLQRKMRGNLTVNVMETEFGRPCSSVHAPVIRIMIIANDPG